MYQYFFKRCFDIVLSLLALICISPILIVFSILLYFANNGAGVFFCQPRPGYKGKIFKVIKFKTMNDNKGPDGNKYLPLYTSEQMRRHDVLPGITGWAQCHGRNAMTWKEKFKYDIWYVDHISFVTDMKVIWFSIKAVLCREGINTNNDNVTVTMEEFNGKN